ncbi:hypothetical protein MM300_02370 [Evansella sp. LMS18]|uniref:hypothetical protein n=1 Tax=Evansella sp. LMS18 TaxID=2924033 RepID=UPI0020CFF45A|nr:hypothetical protein [Evansella sp. LMS18]UTR11198.1 hypothetical protein MM300_02370 [Evansella sp. LMS18]
MKKGLGAFIIVCLLIISACTSDETPADTNTINASGNSDLDTLILTNERLVDEVSEERKENDRLSERIAELEEENRTLKDDLLTYKQKVIDQENYRIDEMKLKVTIDELAKDIFHAMHTDDHDLLNELTADNITPVSANSTLEIEEEDGRLQTFHYLKLNSVNYSRQSVFEYNQDDNKFVALYTFYSAEENDVHLITEVQLTFEEEESWKLASIQYNHK